MNTNKKYGLKDFEKEHGPLTFGEALESYRLGEEISQADMAKRIGISAQSLCDIPGFSSPIRVKESTSSLAQVIAVLSRARVEKPGPRN